MLSIRALGAAALLGMVAGPAAAQVSEAELPAVWQEIEQEAGRVAREAAVGTARYQEVAWAAAKAIAARHDRSAIDALFRSMGSLDTVGTPEDTTYHRSWTKMLTLLVMIEIGDPEHRSSLASRVRSLRIPPHAYNFPADQMRMQAILAMDCFRDEASRQWLLDTAWEELTDLTVPAMQWYSSPSYFALQLLRGYEPDADLRRKLEEIAHVDQHDSEDTGRAGRAYVAGSVLSSWDYAMSLQEPARTRYRSFQSSLWNHHSIPAISMRDSAAVTPKFSGPAKALLDEWQPGDERFVTQIFENRLSTSAELRIAVYLSHKVPVERLKAVAESGSPQAPFARNALSKRERLQSLERQRDE